MSQEEGGGSGRRCGWGGGVGRKKKKLLIREKKGWGRKGGLILDSIPKEISGLGQTAHTLSKITV